MKAGLVRETNIVAKVLENMSFHFKLRNFSSAKESCLENRQLLYVQ